MKIFFAQQIQWLQCTNLIVEFSTYGYVQTSRTMFSLSIIIIIYNLHHISLPTLPSCFFTSNFRTLSLFEKVCIHGDTTKRWYSQGNKFAPDVHEGLKYTHPEAWDQCFSVLFEQKWWFFRTENFFRHLKRCIFNFTISQLKYLSLCMKPLNRVGRGGMGSGIQVYPKKFAKIPKNTQNSSKYTQN